MKLQTFSFNAKRHRKLKVVKTSPHAMDVSRAAPRALAPCNHSEGFFFHLLCFFFFLSCPLPAPTPLTFLSFSIRFILLTHF